MKTVEINMGSESKGKKPTERININTGAEQYREITEDKQRENHEEENPKKKHNGTARTVAAGVAGAAMGGGVAMAANTGTDTAKESEAEPEAEPISAPESKSQTEQEPEQESELEPSPEPAPEPEPIVAPEPETSPHIEEILVDPDDIDGNHIMNIEGTGTVEIEGTEVNATIVTDEAGNSYYLVDVDGEVNDPNATYDIIVDAETGEMTGMPTNLSVGDAQMMADNGIAYTEPVADDSNNIAQAEMEMDIYDPSQPVEEEPAFESEVGTDSLADNGFDTAVDILDPLA